MAEKCGSRWTSVYGPIQPCARLKIKLPDQPGANGDLILSSYCRKQKRYSGRASGREAVPCLTCYHSIRALCQTL